MAGLRQGHLLHRIKSPLQQLLSHLTEVFRDPSLDLGRVDLGMASLDHGGTLAPNPRLPEGDVDRILPVGAVAKVHVGDATLDRGPGAVAELQTGAAGVQPAGDVPRLSSEGAAHHRDLSPVRGITADVTGAGSGAGTLGAMAGAASEHWLVLAFMSVTRYALLVPCNSAMSLHNAFVNPYVSLISVAASEVWQAPWCSPNMHDRM